MRRAVIGADARGRRLAGHCVIRPAKAEALVPLAQPSRVNAGRPRRYFQAHRPLGSVSRRDQFLKRLLCVSLSPRFRVGINAADMDAAVHVLVVDAAARILHRVAARCTRNAGQLHAGAEEVRQQPALVEHFGGERIEPPLRLRLLQKPRSIIHLTVAGLREDAFRRAFDVRRSAVQRAAERVEDRIRVDRVLPGLRQHVRPVIRATVSISHCACSTMAGRGR